MSSAGDSSQLGIDTFRPGRLWSLWDIMQNFQIGPLLSLMDQLQAQHAVGTTLLGSHELTKAIHAKEGKPFDPFLKASQSVIDSAKSWLKIATSVGDALEAQAVHDRVERYHDALSASTVYMTDVISEARTLRETIESSAKYRLFYLYPHALGRELMEFPAHWGNAIKAFPSAEADAHSGIDCLAMGQPNAAVFHMMRTLERGLAALATDVGRTFDRQQWHNILDEIESAIKGLQSTLAKGPAKDERLLFLSQAAKEFRYFKDGWRNYTMHGRSDYDAPQARSVVDHVRTFMNHLATKLHE